MTRTTAQATVLTRCTTPVEGGAQAADRSGRLGGGRVGPAPEPVLPDFDGAGLQAVVPVLLAHLAQAGDPTLPAWVPEPVAEATQIVLLVLDGLGCGAARGPAEPRPGAVVRRSADPITSVAPEHDGLCADHARHGQGRRPSTASSGTESPSTVR